MEGNWDFLNRFLNRRLNRFLQLRLLCDLYDFAALVGPALRASAVWHLLFVAVRTLRQRVFRERVMRAPGGGALLRMSAFRIRHFY